MRDVQIVPRITKTHLLGKVYITINAYDLLTRQYRQSELLNKILMDMFRLKNTRHYNWRLDINASGIQYRIDTETPTELTHGILNLEFELIK